MTVYVDQLVEYPRGTVPGAARATAWCHLFADSLDELHEFATSKLKMKREWFQGPPQHKTPHYDLTKTKRALAIKHGAQERQFTLDDFKRLRAGKRLARLDVQTVARPRTIEPQRQRLAGPRRRPVLVSDSEPDSA